MSFLHGVVGGCVVATAMPFVLQSGQKDLWEVRDSSGRSRVAIIEDGDSVALVLKDAKGVSRLSLTVEADGRAGINMFRGGGEEFVYLGSSKQDAATLLLKSDDGSQIALASFDGGVALLGDVGENKSVFSLSALADKEMSCLVLDPPTRSRSESTVVWSSVEDQKLSGGIRIGGRDAKYQSGLFKKGEDVSMHLGDVPQGGKASGRGISATILENNDGLLALNDGKGNRLVLQNGGVGTGIGGVIHGRGQFTFGGSNLVGPRLRIVDDAGSSVLQLPETGDK
jgi:hypothetical protein